MLEKEDWYKRANALFETCRNRWKEKLRKAAGKGVNIELSSDEILPFTRHEFHHWLSKQIRLQAIPCSYCSAPIDIISCQLDHKTPLRRGGGPELANLQIICARCNQVKGQLTHEEYAELVAFMRGPGSFFRERLEGMLINGGVGQMMRHFPRSKKTPGDAKRKPRQVRLALSQESF